MSNGGAQADGRDEAVREDVDDFFVPLKATGVISNPLSGKSTAQLNVEARYTSSRVPRNV